MPASTRPSRCRPRSKRERPPQLRRSAGLVTSPPGRYAGYETNRRRGPTAGGAAWRELLVRRPDGAVASASHVRLAGLQMSSACLTTRSRRWAQAEKMGAAPLVRTGLRVLGAALAAGAPGDCDRGRAARGPGPRSRASRFVRSRAGAWPDLHGLRRLRGQRRTQGRHREAARSRSRDPPQRWSRAPGAHRRRYQRALVAMTCLPLADKASVLRPPRTTLPG